MRTSLLAAAAALGFAWGAFAGVEADVLALDAWARERHSLRMFDAGITDREHWEDLIAVGRMPTEEERDLSALIQELDVQRYQELYDEDVMLGYARSIHAMRQRLKAMAQKRWWAVAPTWDAMEPVEEWSAARALTDEERYLISDIARYKRELGSSTVSSDAKRVYATGIYTARRDLRALLADQVYVPL